MDPWGRMREGRGRHVKQIGELVWTAYVPIALIFIVIIKFMLTLGGLGECWCFECAGGVLVFGKTAESCVGRSMVGGR